MAAKVQQEIKKDDKQTAAVYPNSKMAEWTKAKLYGNLQMQYLCVVILAVAAFYVTIKGIACGTEKSRLKSGILPESWFAGFVAYAYTLAAVSVLLESAFHIYNSVLLGTSCKVKTKASKKNSIKISMKSLGVFWRILVAVVFLITFCLDGYQLELHEFVGIALIIVLCYSAFVWQWINYCEYVDSAFAVKNENYGQKVKTSNNLLPTIVLAKPGSTESNISVVFISKSSILTPV